MKLLHAVIRFCVTGTATRRSGVAVPQDFRVTVPAPLRQVPDAKSSALTERPTRVVHTSGQHLNPATVLAPQH